MQITIITSRPVAKCYMRMRMQHTRTRHIDREPHHEKPTEKPVFQLLPSYQPRELVARAEVALDVEGSAVDVEGSPALVTAASASLRFFLSRGDCRRTGAPSASAVAAPLNGHSPPLLLCTCRQTLGWQRRRAGGGGGGGCQGQRPASSGWVRLHSWNRGRRARRTILPP